MLCIINSQEGHHVIHNEHFFFYLLARMGGDYISITLIDSNNSLCEKLSNLESGGVAGFTVNRAYPRVSGKLNFTGNLRLPSPLLNQDDVTVCGTEFLGINFIRCYESYLLSSKP